MGRLSIYFLLSMVIACISSNQFSTGDFVVARRGAGLHPTLSIHLDQYRVDGTLVQSIEIQCTNHDNRLPNLGLSLTINEVGISCMSGIKSSTEFWIKSLGGITSLASTEKLSTIRTASDAVMSYITSNNLQASSSFHAYDRNTVYFASDAHLIHKVVDSGSGAVSAYSLRTGIAPVSAVYALETGQTRYVLFTSGNQIYRATDTGSSFTDLTALVTGADHEPFVGLTGMPLSASDAEAKSRDQTRADCLNGACHGQKRSTNGVGETCDDQMWNQDETDVDCGGSVCPKCDYYQYCLSGSDCLSGVCNEYTMMCDGTCVDGLKNQDETDVDCGGELCPQCLLGQMCDGREDCTTQSCVDGMCSETCYDGVTNNNETAVDCGGANCPKCVPLFTCLVDSDCFSGICQPDVLYDVCAAGPGSDIVCEAPTPHVDIELGGCVGLRVVPILECLEVINDIRRAFFSYDNLQSETVTVSGGANWLTMQTSPLRKFLPGRPSAYPNSAFYSETTFPTAWWYLDGYNLSFAFTNESLFCPAEITFYLTSSVTVGELTDLIPVILGNISEITSFNLAQFSATASASTKRQAGAVSELEIIFGGDKEYGRVAITYLAGNNFKFLRDGVPEAELIEIYFKPLKNELAGTAVTLGVPMAPTAVPQATTGPSPGTVSGGEVHRVAWSGLFVYLFLGLWM